MTPPAPPIASHELPNGLQYLCYAWGESDWPVAQFARTRADVVRFFQDQWFGEPPEEMHPDNRANWDDVMAQFDAPEWDMVDTLQWEFEIGGVRVTKVWECGRAAPVVAPAEPPSQSETELLIEELEVAAERITRYTNSPNDGLMTAAADALRAFLAQGEQPKGSVDSGERS